MSKVYRFFTFFKRTFRGYGNFVCSISTTLHSDMKFSAQTQNTWIFSSLQQKNDSEVYYRLIIIWQMFKHRTILFFLYRQFSFLSKNLHSLRMKFCFVSFLEARNEGNDTMERNNDRAFLFWEPFAAAAWTGVPRCWMEPAALFPHRDSRNVSLLRRTFTRLSGKRTREEERRGWLVNRLKREKKRKPAERDITSKLVTPTRPRNRPMEMRRSHDVGATMLAKFIACLMFSRQFPHHCPSRQHPHNEEFQSKSKNSKWEQIKISNFTLAFEFHWLWEKKTQGFLWFSRFLLWRTLIRK